MKTVVITGSARGLGYEMACEFIKNNVNVVISDLNSNKVSDAVNNLNKMGLDAKAVGTTCDVTNPSDIKKLIEYSIKEFKRIDIWINNAGVNQPEKAIWELSNEEIASVIDDNLKGAITGSKLAVEHMIKEGLGAIYNVEGYGSNDAMMLGLSIYGTSKRAITYFTSALAKEVEERNLNIIVGKLSPGIMITDFIQNALGDKEKINLSDKTKKVYNILGDYPSVVAKFLVSKMIKNTKNNVRINWLTNKKAAFRFMTAAFNKRDFFK